MTTHDLGQARRLADEVIFSIVAELLREPLQLVLILKKRPRQAFVNGELLWWRLGKDNLGSKTRKGMRKSKRGL